jgi:lactoylglutathione lyase
MTINYKGLLLSNFVTPPSPVTMSIAMLCSLRSMGHHLQRGARGVANTTTQPENFRVLGVQQIAIGGLDKAPLSHLWSNLLGVPKIGDYKAEKENVDEDILKLGKGPFAVEIDLMQPIDPEKAPKVHVPTLNHIGLWVDDIQAAVTELGEKGVRS